ncbi:MAG: thiamine pyrophosphate-dependent enzyme [Hyphomicrobiaceae bacterium]
MTGTLDRREVVARLLERRGEALVVSGLGAATYDVAAAGDSPRNFYLWGAMGGAASLACGLALARPEVAVVAFTGAGEMLMGLGSFATIGRQAPVNLTIVVLDNGRYGETGAQESHTSAGKGATDLAAVARACGIAQVTRVTSREELADIAADFPRRTDGPHVGVVAIAPTAHPRLVPLRDGAHGRARMRVALGLPAD